MLKEIIIESAPKIGQTAVFAKYGNQFVSFFFINKAVRPIYI